MQPSNPSLSSTPELDADPKRIAAVIFTHSLLEGSMTFIKSQGEALRRYLAVYAGAHRVNGIALPEDRCHVVNDGSKLGVAREAAFRMFGWAPRLVGELRVHRPKVLHAHFGTSGPAGMAIAHALDVPFVVTFHGYDATMHLSEALKTFRGRELAGKRAQMIENAAAIIPVSRFIENKLLEQGYPREKLVLLRNGIDLQVFRPDVAVRREAVVLFVGRFVEKKGAIFLIKAAARLRDEGLNFKLVMIGDGPLAETLRVAARAAQVDCVFPGFLPPAEVRAWLNVASVVAVPSVTAANGDSEGLPTILLEAQAMETPVVATRHSGIPEGLADGVSGELVDERDVHGLAAKIGGFLRAPEKSRIYGHAARQFVSENFDMATQAGRLEDLYSEILAQKR